MTFKNKINSEDNTHNNSEKQNAAEKLQDQETKQLIEDTEKQLQEVQEKFAKKSKLIENYKKQTEEAKAGLQDVENAERPESMFDKIKRLGTEKRWLEFTQDMVEYVLITKDGRSYPTKDFVKVHVDNARFVNNKYPFFGDEFLYERKDYRGQSNLELFNKMKEDGVLDSVLDKSDYTDHSKDLF